MCHWYFLVNNIAYQLLFCLGTVWECVTSSQVCAPFEFGIINEGLSDLGPESTFFGYCSLNVETHVGKVGMVLYCAGDGGRVHHTHHLRLPVQTIGRRVDDPCNVYLPDGPVELLPAHVMHLNHIWVR